MQLIPAILAKTKQEFTEKLKRAGSRFPVVQIDIMDGTLVPYRSWADPQAVGKMRTKAAFELHLMVDDPIAHMRRWAGVSRVKRVIFHIEAAKTTRAVCDILALAYEYGWETVIAVNPRTSLTRVKYFIEDVDELLIMGVQPGRGGQHFIPSTLKKIEQAAAEWDLPIGVDGGVNRETAPAIVRAGATRLMSGKFLLALSPAETKRWQRELRTYA